MSKQYNYSCQACLKLKEQVIKNDKIKYPDWHKLGWCTWFDGSIICPNRLQYLDAK